MKCIHNVVCSFHSAGKIVAAIYNWSLHRIKRSLSFPHQSQCSLRIDCHIIVSVPVGCRRAGSQGRRSDSKKANKVLQDPFQKHLTCYHCVRGQSPDAVFQSSRK